jgi:quinol---cytochrome c reductase cytochrome b subunit, bacillus type
MPRIRLPSKLPSPPPGAVPKALRPSPSRPQEGNGKRSLRDRAIEDGAEAGTTVVDWVDERTSLSGAVRWTLFRKVPRGTNWFYTLGSATLFAFLNQAVTGVFLAMYYDPSPTRAYESIRFVTNEAFLGEFVRGMHKWGSSVMVILIFLHMARVFFFGAYKYPRELNWVIGVVLLILTMTMAFTGYLLPFDQRSYWATIVGVNINGTGPFVGRLRRHDLVAFLRDPHVADTGRHSRAHRGAPVLGRQARDHRAAVAQGRVGAGAARARGLT